MEGVRFPRFALRSQAGAAAVPTNYPDAGNSRACRENVPTAPVHTAFQSSLRLRVEILVKFVSLTVDFSLNKFPVRVPSSARVSLSSTSTAIDTHFPQTRLEFRRADPIQTECAYSGVPGTQDGFLALRRRCFERRWVSL